MGTKLPLAGSCLSSSLRSCSFFLSFFCCLVFLLSCSRSSETNTQLLPWECLPYHSNLFCTVKCQLISVMSIETSLLFCHHGWVLGHCHSFLQLRDVNINWELVPPPSRPIRTLESQEGKGTANEQPLVIQRQSMHNRLIPGIVSGNFPLTSMGFL